VGKGKTVGNGQYILEVKSRSHGMKIQSSFVEGGTGEEKKERKSRPTPDTVMPGERNPPPSGITDVLEKDHQIQKRHDSGPERDQKGKKKTQQAENANSKGGCKMKKGKGKTLKVHHKARKWTSSSTRRNSGATDKEKNMVQKGETLRKKRSASNSTKKTQGRQSRKGGWGIKSSVQKHQGEKILMGRGGGKKTGARKRRIITSPFSKKKGEDVIR